MTSILQGIRELAVEDLHRFGAKKLHNLRIEYAVEALAGSGRVLEIGSGEGFCSRSIVYWAKQKPVSYDGFDVDSARVAKAASLWSDDGRIRYSSGDAQKPFPYSDGSFDAVVMLDILEHLEDPERALREAARVLKKGGVFFLVVPCENEPWTVHRALHGAGWQGSFTWGGHVKYFTKKEVLGMLEAVGFTPRRSRFSCHWIGQLTDAAGFHIKHLTDQKAHGRLCGVKGIQLYLLKKSMKVFLQKMSYAESKLFSRVGFGAMDLNITCSK